VVLAILIGVGLAIVIRAIAEWPLGDLKIYLGAAQRIRDGQALYAVDVPSYEAFWYAPWFALVFVPASFLPYQVVAIVWSAILVVASIATVVPLLRMRTRAGVALASLVLSLLIGVSAGGNVQPLLVLALSRTRHRPSGPVWIALAASLKLTPALLILAYAAERTWRRALVAALLTSALLAPGLVLGQFREVSGGIDALALFGISPIAYGLSVAAACLAVFIVRRRYATLVASIAGVLALPRLFAYDITLVMVGVNLSRGRIPDKAPGGAAANRADSDSIGG
jgi:hypothetical protein